MTETLLKAFGIGMVFGLTFALGYLLGEWRGRKVKVDATVQHIKGDPNQFLNSIKNRHESDLFTVNREN